MATAQGNFIMSTPIERPPGPTAPETKRFTENTD